MSTLVTDCPRCGTKHTTFDYEGKNHIGNGTAGWDWIFETFMTCRHCGKSTTFILHFNNYNLRSHFLETTGRGWVEGSHLNDYFKVIRFLSVRDLASASPPEHVPADVAGAFEEGATCLSVECFNAAATMFRLSMDIATRQFLPNAEDTSVPQPNSKQRRDLGLRLPWLFDNGFLPNDLRDLAACVKEDGNDGAHAGLLTNADANDLLDFAERLLERLYTEPKRIELAAARRAERREAKSP